MTRKPLVAASGFAALCVAASLTLLGGGRFGGTFAAFNAQTKNAGSAFAGGWVVAPTPGSLAVSGADVNLTWAVGSQGVASQQVYYADNGTSTDCSSVTWSALGSALQAAATGTTDAGRGSSANGHYICYRVDSVNNSWTRTSTYASPVRVGFYATSVTLANSGSANRFDSGDSITVVFNQPPQLPSASAVCIFRSTTNAVLIGDTSGCTNGTSSLFVLTLSSGSINRSSTSYTASYSVAGNTLTVTLGNQPSPGQRPQTSSPAWVFNPGTLTSATGAVALCADPTCIPTPSGNV